MYSAIGAGAEITADVGAASQFEDSWTFLQLCKQRADMEALRELYAHTEKPNELTKLGKKWTVKLPRQNCFNQTNFRDNPRKWERVP